jgi:5-methylcytosine-specific restriction endonuclease McrA
MDYKIRRCYHCGRFVGEDKWHRKYFGPSCLCKQCSSILAYFRNKKNPERKREICNRSREKNRQKVREYNRRYRKERSDLVLANTRKRQLTTRGCIPEDANLNNIKMFYTVAKQMSESGCKYEVDHIIPISRGGLHHENNLQILPEHINRQKRNSIDDSIVGLRLEDVFATRNRNTIYTA